MNQDPIPSPSQTEVDAYALYMNDKDRTRNLARKGGWIIGVGFGLYSAIAVMLSATGVYASIHPNFFALTIVFSMSALVLAYFKLPSVRAFAEWVGPYHLASFHIWRIGAALAFLYYGAQGWLPDIFVNLAGWGDMLAGVLAAGLVLIPTTFSRIKAVHIIGMADFVVAVGTGLTLQLLQEPLIANLVYLPIALIPLVGVPLSGASHVVALHILGQQNQAN